MTKTLSNKSRIAGGLLIASLAVSAQAELITFDDLSLAPDSAFDPGYTTAFTSGSAVFDHDAPYGDCCWSGFTYSNRTDTTTPGYLNDMAAYTGTGVGAGQDNYAVGHANATLRFGGQSLVQSAYFTNTTYAYLAMVEGNDGNQTPFIKGPFGEGDFFTLTVNGLDANDQIISSIDVPLAVGAAVLSDWAQFDLAGLGAVFGLNFTLASSDSGQFGINTPAYFAMDNIQVAAVPVPAALWLFGSALIGLAGVSRRRSPSA